MRSCLLICRWIVHQQRNGHFESNRFWSRVCLQLGMLLCLNVYTLLAYSSTAKRTVILYIPHWCMATWLLFCAAPYSTVS